MVKNKRIVQEWATTEWPKGYPRSRLEITLTPKKGGTELKLVQTKVSAGQVEDYTGGWYSAYWEPLAEYLKRKK